MKKSTHGVRFILPAIALAGFSVITTALGGAADPVTNIAVPTSPAAVPTNAMKPHIEIPTMSSIGRSNRISIEPSKTAHPRVGAVGPMMRASAKAGPSSQLVAARERMVSEQLVARGITDPAVLEAMRKVPRLLPFESASDTYEDKPVEFRAGRTVESSFVVASVAEKLKATVKSNGRVLEIGTGSGYQTAVLSLIVGEVYSVESNEGLALTAKADLQSLGYTNNVFLRTGDVLQGWPEAAPFDAVVLNAPFNQGSDAITGQLKEGGQLIVAVDEKGTLQVLQKTGGRLVPAGSKLVRLPQAASNKLVLPTMKKLEVPAPR